MSLTTSRVRHRLPARRAFWLVAFASAVALSAPAALHAQNSVVGTWRIEFPRGIQMENGEETVSEWGHARAVFEMKGDSVIGMWTSTDSTHTPNKTRRLTGKIDGGKIHLVSDPIEATMNGPGGESKIKLVMTYELEVVGDKLTGTQRATPMGGEGPDGGQLPVKGSREKS